jgi:hypothetical protein
MKRIAIASTISSALILSACVSTKQSTEIAQFDAAIQKAATALEKYYQGVNDLERQAYIDKLRFSHAPMGTTEGDDSHATGLVAFFDPDDVQIRVDTLTLLGKYAAGLDELASSDAPAQVAKSLQSMSSDIDGLSKNIAILSKGNKKAVNADYGKPISDIASMVGEAWVQHKKEKMLTSSILDNSKRVDEVLGYLERDLQNVQHAYEAAGDQSLSARELFYSANISTSNDFLDAKKIAFLQETQAVGATRARVASADPLSLIRALRQMHKDVVDSVVKGRSKEVQHEKLLGELQLLSIQAQRFSDAVDQLVPATKPAAPSSK